MEHASGGGEEAGVAEVAGVVLRGVLAEEMDAVGGLLGRGRVWEVH